MRRAWRIIFATGLVLLLVPTVAVGWLDQRKWVMDGVYGAGIYAGTVLVVSWGLGELIFHFFPMKSVALVVLLESVPLAAVPSFYVNAATFVGRPSADFNTWHLLPLFAATYQIAATVVVVAFAVLAVGVGLAYRAVKRNAAA